MSLRLVFKSTVIQSYFSLEHLYEKCIAFFIKMHVIAEAELPSLSNTFS